VAISPVLHLALLEIGRALNSLATNHKAPPEELRAAVLELSNLMHSQEYITECSVNSKTYGPGHGAKIASAWQLRREHQPFEVMGYDGVVTTILGWSALIDYVYHGPLRSKTGAIREKASNRFLTRLKCYLSQGRGQTQVKSINPSGIPEILYIKKLEYDPDAIPADYQPPVRETLLPAQLRPAPKQATPTIREPVMKRVPRKDFK
jgi:hypothetical protein